MRVGGALLLFLIPDRDTLKPVVVMQPYFIIRHVKFIKMKEISDTMKYISK